MTLILSLLTSLLQSKLAMAIGGILAAVGLVYFKGYSSAKSSDETDQLEAEEAQDSRIRAAQAKNDFLEKTGVQTNAKISSADTVDSIISLFNEVGDQQAKDSDAASKPDSNS